MLDELEQVFEEVKKERLKQDARFGWPRRHDPSWWLTILVEEVGEYARDVCEKEFFHGKYRDNMREELIQVAAVAIAAIQDLDIQEEEDKW